MAAAPERAHVAPRAIAPGDPEPMLLADLIDRYADSGIKTIRVSGPGKSVALSFLNTEFEHRPHLNFVDDADFECINSFQHHPQDKLVFSSHGNCQADVELKLVSWGQDEVIEYLMDKAPSRCKSVMSRLIGADDQWLTGSSPFVWSIVLDSMIESDDVPGVADAILKHFDQIKLDRRQRVKIRRLCTQFLVVKLEKRIDGLVPHVLRRDDCRFLGTIQVCLVLAAELEAESLINGKTSHVSTQMWPYSFVELVAKRISKTEGGFARLERFLNKLANKKDSRVSAQIASLLVYISPDWRPATRKKLNFENAQLANAKWDQLTLLESNFASADMANANLAHTKLDNSNFMGANFFGANLSRSSLIEVRSWRANFTSANLKLAAAREAKFRYADFSSANLQYADLQGVDFGSAKLNHANFRKSNLEYANFCGAKFEKTNFSGARLARTKLQDTDLRGCRLLGSCFDFAEMQHCNLQSQVIPKGSCVGANLDNAVLSYSRLRGCAMRHVSLQGAKLGKIRWEGCDLRKADFSGCHFFMGSTRSGLVGSPYPSHGTRTGFYTDDYDDHYFKTPEQIRKACLVGCDLRGAKVEEADFYLVDLREAKYDSDQEKHFRLCGAILCD